LVKSEGHKPGHTPRKMSNEQKGKRASTGSKRKLRRKAKRGKMQEKSALARRVQGV